MSDELLLFQHHLEHNLSELWKDLDAGSYCHGAYRMFIVCDNKRREVSVASIRDRVVHRLLYDYLTGIYDKTFIHDAWSCRVGKGVLGAIERTQYFLRKYPHGYVWKADVQKFFDSVDQEVLITILQRKVRSERALALLREVISQFSSSQGEGKGMPIGNLTSQIFANIYMNELDRLIQHELKPKGYVRYCDDFVIVEEDAKRLCAMQKKVKNFLQGKLLLQIHSGNETHIKPQQGVKFLGVYLWPWQRTLNARTLSRMRGKLCLENVPSYYGLVMKYGSEKLKEEFGYMY